jgi:hypothetical protein
VRGGWRARIVEGRRYRHDEPGMRALPGAVPEELTAAMTFAAATRSTG